MSFKVYPCDQREECSRSFGCGKNGGICYRTSDIHHAMKFFECIDCEHLEETIKFYESPICQKCNSFDKNTMPTNWKNNRSDKNENSLL